jgi:acetolactate synthase-1/2/3 large subunit
VKLSDYVIQRLAAEVIDTAFVVDGAAAADLIHSVNSTDGIDYVCMQHEQAAAFAAEAWAKVAGRPGLVIATSGPGGQNLVTGLANAFYDSTPLIALTGQVRTEHMLDDPRVRQRGFQESPIVDIVRPITKASFCLKDPAGVRYWLEYLIWKCKEGRPGPVLLDIPIDVQRADIDPDTLSPFRPMEEPWDTGLDDVLYDLMTALAKARRPAILIGGGARSCEKELTYVADRMGIPVFTTWNATDIITGDQPAYGGHVGTYGGPGRNFGIQNADVLVAIGTRVSGRITGGRPDTFARAARRYLVNLDPLVARGHDVKWDRFCHRDAKTFLAAWVKLLGQSFTLPHFGDWLERCRQWKGTYDPVLQPPEDELTPNPYRFIRALSDTAPSNAIVVGDCGGNLVTLMHSWKTKKGQRLFSSNGNSPMGFSLAGAIGAWFADPSRPVVCIIGDGGLQVNIQELQTVAHYKIPLKLVVLDNGCYGITKAFQETNFGGKAVACDEATGYSRPRLANLLYTYLPGTTVWDLRVPHGDPGIMFKTDKAFTTVVDCPGFRTYEPRIADGQTPIEDMSPKLPDAEFAANMLIPSLRPKPFVKGPDGM